MKNYNNRNNEIMSRNNSREYDLFDPLREFFGIPTENEIARANEFSNLMKTDVKEYKDKYELFIDLPGYDKKDIDLDMDSGYLTISATKRKENNEEASDHKYIRQERYFGNVKRSFYVGDIKEENIEARLNNGILTIIVPKENKTNEKKRIEIK